jgi:hypothetical protein
MKFVFTPDWFLGKDILIEAFSFVVLFTFSFLCMKNYKINKSKKSLYLGTGFILIALAQLATIATKLVLYYDIGPSQEIGSMIIAYQLLSSVDIFYYIGFFAHKFLTLIGFYIIYRLPIEKNSRKDFFLTLYFIIIFSIFSIGINYLFHTTALVLLLLITRNYFQVYKKNKSSNTKILITAFALLSLSNVIFILSKMSTMYVVANIIGLISYVILLILIIRILKYGKKTKQDGHNIRHTDSNQGKRW